MDAVKFSTTQGLNRQHRSTLLGSRFCDEMGDVKFSKKQKTRIAKVDPKTELNNGMGAVQHPNPIGF
jgi:hypothetical protein